MANIIYRLIYIHDTHMYADKLTACFRTFLGMLSRGVLPWIDPCFGFTPILNTWTNGCAPRFHGSIQHFAPTILVTWYMTSLSKTGSRLQEMWVFFCYYSIVLGIDEMKLLQWNILLIVNENKHEPMSCVVYSRIEKAVSFRGCKSVGWHWFAPMGAVDQSCRCAPRLNTPLVCRLKQQTANAWVWDILERSTTASNKTVIMPDCVVTVNASSTFEPHRVASRVAPDDDNPGYNDDENPGYSGTPS